MKALLYTTRSEQLLEASCQREKSIILNPRHDFGKSTSWTTKDENRVESEELRSCADKSASGHTGIQDWTYLQQAGNFGFQWAWISIYHTKIITFCHTIPSCTFTSDKTSKERSPARQNLASLPQCAQPTPHRQPSSHWHAVPS